MYILTCAYYDKVDAYLTIDYVKPFNTHDDLSKFLKEDYKYTTSELLKDYYKSVYTYESDDMEVMWRITSLSIEAKGE